MSGILTFAQYLGGADNMQLLTAFPSSQTQKLYNFGQDITGWTFEADYQTIVVDAITYNRHTGDPNFATSTVIGTFPKTEITGANAPEVVDLATGTVKLTLPANMYTGGVIPDARQNVPIVIVGFTWTTADTPATIETHRWAIIQAWEPDVPVGDPTQEVGYTAITLGA